MSVDDKRELGARSPDGRHRVRDDYVCRNCGMETYPVFSRFNFLFSRCKSCGCLQKILTEGEYRNLNVTYDPGSLFSGAGESDIRELFEIEKKKRFLQAAGVTAEKPKFLDIGCGHGEYLLAAKELGWDTLGIEPSVEHSEVGRSVFGLEILTGLFSSDKFAGNSFDLILLNHVIEHIYDTRSFVDDITRVLTQTGKIIMVTPNAASSVALITGKYWPMLKPPDHVTMMTPRAFQALESEKIKCEIRTGEYVWESMATIIQACRDFLKERLSGEGTGLHRGSAARTELKRHRLKIFLAILSVVSSPFYLVNRVFNRGACLIVAVSRKH